MSDTSWSPSVPKQRGGGDLLDAVLPLLYGWLPAQRWFAGKGRPIAEVEALSATELATPAHGSPGLLHLLLRVRHVGAQPSAGDCYQLLLGTRPTMPTYLAAALIGRIDGGPHDGMLVYDAPHDPQQAARLLDHLSGDGHIDTLRFNRVPGADVPTHLPPRVGTAEQSNTSVVYGDALILKLFRRVSPGTNPDLELSLALTRSGSEHVAAPVAWFDTRWPGTGEETTLGLVQRFLSGSADGWELALTSVPNGEYPVPEGDFTGEAYLLGQATAEVHRVLARELPVVELGEEEIGRLAEAMAERLDAAAAAVPELAPHRTSLRTAFHDLAQLGRGGHVLRAQRIHGDLHLGQVLRTTEGWVLIDFEGEPARPLAERRRPQPPEQDVAGMLRSFDYAARYHLVGADAPTDDGRQAEEWAERNRAAFCAGYAAVGDHDPTAEPVVMRAFETDKAVYEVLYEARHRPTWLPVPMSAITRLAAQRP